MGASEVVFMAHRFVGRKFLYVLRIHVE